MSTATYNPIELAGLCRNCRVLLETPSYQPTRRGKFEFGSQIWTCAECGKARKWGSERPWDSTDRPVLNCEGSCEAVTRHVFLRVEGY